MSLDGGGQVQANIQIARELDVRSIGSQSLKKQKTNKKNVTIGKGGEKGSPKKGKKKNKNNNNDIGPDDDELIRTNIEI